MISARFINPHTDFGFKYLSDEKRPRILILSSTRYSKENVR